MLDVYRCWDLWDLVGQVEKLDEGGIFEAGAWRGGSAYVMQERMKRFEFGPLIVCDWEINRIEKELLSDATILKLRDPKLLDKVPPLRLIHLDVNSHESTQDYDECLWKHLVVGGIVVYDDYGWKSCPGVAAYVDSQKDMIDRLVMYNLNGHGVVVKLGGDR
jgi:O-methyltransferase